LIVFLYRWAGGFFPPVQLKDQLSNVKRKKMEKIKGEFTA